MKTVLLFLSIGIAAGVLFVNIYSSLVDVKSWSSDIPNSISTARDYFKTVSPGNFFRVFSPLNQVLSLLVVVLFWKAAPSLRLYLGIAFILYVLGDVLTFSYFYPRNDLMFKTASLTDTDLLRKTVNEWAAVNWIRSMVILAGLVFSCLSLHKWYLSQH